MAQHNLFQKKPRLYLDGGMGTMLQKSGMPAGEIPEKYNIEHPEQITAIHKAFLAAGSDIVYANTFGANRLKMKKSGYSVQELISAGIACGKAATAGTDAMVALDIGPIGQLLEPLGTLKFEEAYDIFREEIEAGTDADLIVIETMTDLQEARAALLAAKENSSLPVIVTMTYEERGRTFLALRGQVSCVETGKKPYVVGSTGDKAELFSQIDRDGWNECHVIARGHTLIHLINGHVMSVVVDDDPQERTSEGLIGMQVHVGPPMKIEFRNIRLKTDRKEVSGR